ncbi:helix-turn-helix domain-containing protein [Pseudodonghicola flavimaris]|uniref:Helix-turn-helix transcriptional regulator n=1 Tax=Pseudodonghicola flavimaris TaxID=3050036 RepID=A0ABT7F3T1_9RHOB|nr:helix-turn-helix transcriptional regulator [Pseudodonghicola flavimaris]MDK3019262.1 helix-turn-helix transcriptional regulator [Pseudodonghicola flavimaris]
MNKIDLLVGQRIRARRHALGISQTELGEAIGVKFQQIQKYETGANRVSASRLWAVAEKLGVDIVYFFEGIRPATPTDKGLKTPVDHMDFLSDQDAILMMELFRKLPGPQRSAVLSFVQSLTTPPKPKKVGLAT